MTLSAVVVLHCLKRMRPIVSLTGNMGPLIVFTCRLLMSVFCLVTAELNTAGTNNSTPSLHMLYLSPSTPNHTHNLIPPPSIPSHTYNHPRRDKKKQQTKASLMAACFKKEERAWKGSPLKVQPGAQSRTTRGRLLTLTICFDGTEKMQQEMQYVQLPFYFVFSPLTKYFEEFNRCKANILLMSSWNTESILYF